MPSTFSLDWPPGIYIVHVDRRTSLTQDLMKMGECWMISRIVPHHCSSFVTVLWAFSDVGDV